MQLENFSGVRPANDAKGKREESQPELTALVIRKRRLACVFMEVQFCRRQAIRILKRSSAWSEDADFIAATINGRSQIPSESFAKPSYETSFPVL